jgi:uncharacterized membrane protein YraQ (UPF0718 family)
MLATLLHAGLMALIMAAAMGWQMLWALVLGFLISGAIQAAVSHADMAKLLPDDRWPSILKAAALGAASSSCSYAAAAITRSIVKTGGDFRAAMAFQFASTNLVVELGLILLSLMGWRFMAASWLGGLLMIPIVVALLRLFMSRRRIEAATAVARRDAPGRMEGHAAMDMSVEGPTVWKRLASAEGATAVAHFFYMDWASLWTDLLLGLLIAGAIGAWVPAAVWAHLFMTSPPFASHPWIGRLAGPLIGPLVAMVTFVCSVGNVPLAAVLWRGGASFGGVVAFIFGDLIVLPLLDIYRRYYGLKAAALMFVAFYLAMALAGLGVEGLFAVLHLTPTRNSGAAIGPAFAWNATTWLDFGAIAIAAILGWRFLTTGGPAMLKAMHKATPDSEPSDSGSSKSGPSESGPCSHAARHKKG